jgi:hypothetical protein
MLTYLPVYICLTCFQARHACIREMESAKQCVALLLEDNPAGILLSQFKRRFTAKFRRTIVPTTFGHIKLSSLLTSPPMDEVGMVVRHLYLRSP